jgi:hypothetical protein
MRVTAVSADIVDGALPENRFRPRYLRRHAHISQAPSRPKHPRRDNAYSSTRLVSATMLSRIGPVKLFLCKSLITHARAGDTIKAATRAARPPAQRSVRRSGRTPAGKAWGRTGT